MFEQELKIALEAIVEASKTIMEIYEKGFHVETKPDDSPVTEADKASEKVILSSLRKHFPTDSILSEETDDDLSRLKARRVWIIDPLDGTKEFVKKNGQFAVNVALSLDGEIVLGLIASPTEGKVYYATKGEGAYLFDGKTSKKIYVSQRMKGEAIMLTSGSKRNKEELMPFYNEHKEWFASEPIALGSSLKMAKIASGEADFFYRSNAVTKEWDVAPASVILKEAGGLFLEGRSKKEFVYNKEDLVNHHGYIAINPSLKPLLDFLNL